MSVEQGVLWHLGRQTHVHSLLERWSQQEATKDGFVPCKCDISETGADGCLPQEPRALNNHVCRDELKGLGT